MSKASTYTIPIKGLSDMVSNNTLSVIKDASRVYHSLLTKNISKFSKSGRLRASWKFELYNPTKSSVYSDLPYARIRDKGGRIEITRKMRNFAWHMYYKTKNKMWRYIAITKKKYIIQKGANYSNVNLNIIKQFIEAKYGS